MDRLNSLPDSAGVNNLIFKREERFVDADAAAAFLVLSRKHVLKLARQRVIPPYPLGLDRRKIWRFRIRQLRWMKGQQRKA